MAKETCSACGKPVTRTKRSCQQIICQDCRWEHQLVKTERPAKRTIEPHLPAVCQECGCDFLAVAARQRFCSRSCRERQSYRLKGPTGRSAPCGSCGKPVGRRKTSTAEPTCQECRRKEPKPYGPRSGSVSAYRDASGKLRIDAICEECGEPFKSRRNGQSATGWTRYCSLRCANKVKNRNRPRMTPQQRRARQKARRSARDRQRRQRIQSATWDGITDQEILERDQWMCWICKRRIGKTFKYPHKRSASIDHLIPLALGGDDTAFNKKAAHLGCNMSRGTGRQDEHPMLNFSLDPDVEIRPRARRLPTYKPQPCKICGELRQKGFACSLHEPVRYGTCRRCSTPIIKRGRTSICQACERCAADGCRNAGGFGRDYCAPHYHRLNRYGDVFSDVPLAQDRSDRLEVAALIRLRLAKDAAA